MAANVIRRHYADLVKVLSNSQGTLSMVTASFYGAYMIDRNTRNTVCNSTRLLSSSQILLDHIEMKVEQSTDYLQIVFDIFEEHVALKEIICKMKLSLAEIELQRESPQQIHTQATGHCVLTEASLIPGTETNDVSSTISAAEGLNDTFNKLLFLILTMIRQKDIDLACLKLKISRFFYARETTPDIHRILNELHEHTSSPEMVLFFLISRNLLGYQNFHLLKVFTVFLSDDIEFNQKLKEYRERHQRFIRHNLQNIVKAFKQHPGLAPASVVGLPEINVQLEQPWEGKSYHQWKEIVQNIVDWLDHLLIKSIEFNCIITYYVLPFILCRVVMDLNNEAIIRKFSAVGATFRISAEVLKLAKLESEWIYSVIQKVGLHIEEHDDVKPPEHQDQSRHKHLLAIQPSTSPASVPHECGFDDEIFISPPAKDLQCPICQLTLREPCQLTCCGATLCEVCVDSSGAKVQCPCCRDKDHMVMPDKKTRRQIMSLKVKCIKADCRWYGKLFDLQTHWTGSCPKQIADGSEAEKNKQVSLLPTKLEPKPVGFKNVSDPSAMMIIFRAIILTHVWGIEDDEPAVYIRFGDDALGKWKFDLGPGSVEKNLGDGFLQLQFFLRLESSFLARKKIEYKYLVYSAKMTRLSDAYEFLHDFDDANINRCLEVPSARCAPQAEYQQYDSMICPEAAKITNQKDHFVKWLKKANREKEVLIPQPSQMRQICLEHYLAQSKDILLDDKIYESYDIPQVTDDLVHIYHCLYSQKGSLSGRLVQEKCMESLKEVIANWLLSSAEELFDRQSMAEDKKLVSAISLLVAYDKLRSQYSISVLNNKELHFLILRMVCTSPGADYSYLKTLTKSEQSKSIVLNSLVMLFNYIVDKTEDGREAGTDDLVLYLLKLFPIIHFLRDDCTPRQVVTFDVSKLSWWDPHLSIKALHEALINKSGLMQGVIDEISSYFLLDPLLIPIVVYLCPKDDLPLLCDHVPLYLIIQVINHELSAKRSLNRSEIESYISKPLLAMMKKFVQREFKPTNHSAHLATLKTFLSLSLRLLNSSEKDMIGVINSAFVTLAFALNTTGDEKDHCHSMVKTFIQQWISKDSVVGGSMFGGSWDWHYKKLKRKDTEMKLWKNILDNTAHKDYAKLPSQIKGEWMNILSFILDSRVANVTDRETKVELFCDLEKQQNPQFFSNVFTFHAAKAVNDIFSSQQSSSFNFFQKTQSVESARIMKYFSSLLNEKYPRFSGSGSLNLNELLDWELWPGFLKIFATHSKFVQDVNQDWQTSCACALTLFESVCARIISGEISAKELSLIKSKEEQMIRLTTAVTSFNTGNYLTPKALKQSIQKKSEEYKFFNTFKAKLEYLASIISCDAIVVKDLNRLLVLLKRDNTADPINSLCTEENKVYRIRCYPGAEVLFPYVEQFLLIFKTYPTKIFKAIWERKLAEVESTKNPLTYENLIETWKILLDDCKSLLECLRSLKMRLVDIDQELKGFYTNQMEVLHDLQNLNTAVSMCYNEIPDPEWVKEVSCRISQYWELCEYHEPARALLKIRDSIKLEGDFSIVERVASQKFEAEDTLKSIDQSVVVASRFLKAYAADKRRQQCLQAFSECQRIVEWIRNLGRRGNDDSESNINDLQNFVNIALATTAGGEGEYTTDKLVNLRIIGSGFGPLIYKLPKTADYQLLQYHCQDLWKALHDARNLPEIMRACEKKIQWYKSIYETLSVEKTSFGQMKNINQLGHYEIGSIRSGRLTSRSEAIHVRLREPEDKNKTLPQYRYNLDELRDLESKLVLIAGPESSERKNVDLFLDTFHSVCRIADVLMELQHHGNTEYIRWSLRFSCSMSQVFELLKYQAKKMESDLENWQNQVKYQRDRIYELNYFTTPQLLALREELGTFSDSMEQKPQVKSDVMNLLYGISRCLTPGLIKDALVDKSESPEPPGCLQSNVQEQTKIEDIKTPSSNLEKKANTFEGKSTEKQEITEIRDANFPNPHLTFEDLIQEQKSHLYNLVAAGYHVSLVLLGFERCSATSNMLEDVANWCEVHNDDFDYPESEDSDSYIDSESDSDESLNVDESREGLEAEETVAQEKDSIENGEPTKEPISVEGHETKREDEKKIGRREEGATDFKQVSEFNPLELIETKELIPLDKNHPAVVKLLGLGFPLERCLDAVEKFKNDTSQAIDYIISDDKQGTSSVASDTDGTLEQEAGEEILEKMRIEIPDKSSKSYMSLSDLGQLLHKLAKEHEAPVPQPREIPDPIKSGECNLLVVPSGHVLKTTLSLFMESPELPLPTHEEVLICNEQTTAEETNLLWKRALGDPGYKRIFCLVHAECLLYQVWDRSLSELQQLSQGKKGFKIVIICSNEDEEKSNIISKLQMFRRPYQGIHSDDDFLEYLKSHFIQEKGNCKVIQASSVDKECSSVRIVSSTRAGMGKSLYIRRLKEKLVDSTGNDLCEVIVPVHGPKVNAHSLIESLSEHFVLTEATIFHIDISQTVLRMVDSLLFSLLILQTVCDSKGRVWRVNPAHLYVVEVTIPEDEGKQLIAQSTIDFLKIFPTIHCKSPKSVLRMISNEESG